MVLSEDGDQPMTKLSDTQAVILSAASQRDNGAVLPLSPDIIDAIIAGSADQSLMLEQLERPLPASWEEQRDKLA